VTVRQRLIVLVVGLSAILVVPSASEALTIGAGNVFSSPGLAVDASGTAYIAWRGPESGAGSLQFCRLPRGALACDIRSAIAAPGDTVSRAFVVVSGSRVIVLQYRYGGVSGMYAFTSADGGASFSPGRVVGSVPFFEAVPGPGDTLSGVTNAESAGAAFQNVPLDGSANNPATYATLSPDHPYNGAIGLIDAATPLAVSTNGSDAGQFRYYTGTGDLNDVAHWTPPSDLGLARYPKLAGGPSGLFLIATAADNAVFARKWNGATFGAPVTIAAGADAPTLSTFQDAAGRLHAIFVRGDADGLHLIHAVSDDGTSWRSGTVVTQTAAEGGFSATRIATAPDHVGVAVWNAAFGEIRVAAVGPDAPGPPETKIGSAPKKKSLERKAKFTFTSTKPGSSFECKLDKRAFSPCTSPKKVKVKPGKHVFQVRGVDAAGVADASPARFKWRVLKRRHH
jgi:hypothetical protein